MLIIEITNTLKHRNRPERGHYSYKVRVNDRIIAEGEVEDHIRALGWQGLLEAVAKDGRHQAAISLVSWLQTTEQAIDEALK